MLGLFVNVAVEHGRVKKLISEEVEEWADDEDDWELYDIMDEWIKENIEEED